MPEISWTTEWTFALCHSLTGQIYGDFARCNENILNFDLTLAVSGDASPSGDLYMESMHNDVIGDAYSWE